jgi:hypothetical protein
LYILHEASHAWNAKLDDTPLSLGFQRTPAEHAIYVQWNGDAQLVVGVYIDDLIITNSYCDDIKLFREKMAAAFKMSDLNLLHCYLGIEVNQSVSGIFLNQCAYAMKLLELWHGGMQFMSCAHRGTLEAEQAEHTVIGGCYNILEHCQELEIFGEYLSRSCICCWLRESFSGGATRGSPCSDEADSQ